MVILLNIVAAERSFAMSTVSNDKLAHQKLEQPTTGCAWIANGKPVMCTACRRDATRVVAGQLDRRAGCEMTVLVPAGAVANTDSLSEQLMS